MRRIGKRPALIAGIGTAVAGAAAALALAATGPGVPETRAYGGGFAAFITSASARLCTGTDGDYLELLGSYQSTADDTESNDPRFDGLATFSLHQLLRFNEEEFAAGHIDGTVTYYAS